MQVKGFLWSKLNWLGILTVLVAIGEMADQLPEPIGKYALLVSGIATVILRTFGTSTQIKIGGPPA